MSRIFWIWLIFMAGFITESWGAKIRIDIRDDIGFKFCRAGTNICPARETIAVGDTVEWVHIGFTSHTTTSDSGVTPGWDSGLMTTGSTFRFPFSQTGIFPYHCIFHSEVQRDTVYVQPACIAKAGDANGDGNILLSDVVVVINFLFKSGVLSPLCRGNANGDGSVLLSDVVYLVNFLFKSGAAPVKNNECCL